VWVLPGYPCTVGIPVATGRMRGRRRPQVWAICGGVSCINGGWGAPVVASTSRA